MAVATNQFAPEPGELIGRRIHNYKIVSLLGEGGMGSVYLAEHADLGKRVAVKIIAPWVTQNHDVVARFYREARVLQAIDNAHIVDVLDAGTFLEDKVMYIVMSYLPGGSLEALCERQGPLPLELAASIMIQICSGLDAVHSASIVHRDMKCQNVVISRRRGLENFATIVDFGIAKTYDPKLAAGHRTNMSAVLGTPGMMSPEQARGHTDVDGRADIYSLGGMLYRMVTGQAPFNADTGYAMIEKQAKASFARPRALRPDLPAAWDTLIVDCLAIERARRPSTVREVAHRLALGFPQADAMLTVLAPSLKEDRNSRPQDVTMSGSGLEATIARWPSTTQRRHPMPIILAALAGLGLGAGAVVATQSAMRDEHSDPASPQSETAHALAPDARTTAIVTMPTDAATFAVVPSPPADAAIADAGPPPHGASALLPNAPERGAGALPAAGPPRAAERPAAAALTRAKLKIYVKPWAEVFVGGKGGRQTPFAGTLAPGTHQLRLAGAKRVEQFEIVVDPVRGTTVTSDSGTITKFKPGRPIEIKRDWE